MTTSPIELWGGIECTINRVGDTFLDQLEYSGHYGRPDDLDAIAALGIRTLRYPALWERVAPDGLERADWRHLDERLSQLRALEIEPIIGLVHHGSGPKETDLLDPQFATRLARYAAAFADRYPWIRRFTPINEPLTTARFAGLYGLWYPHRRDDRAFVSALVNQCAGIAAAMAAIRLRSPNAELVQTEDAGSVRSTRDVASQAAFENHRRWLSVDLLTGRVDDRHPLWNYLLASGADTRQLGELREWPTPPAVVGLNYYLTSDRYLDHRLERYPVSLHGGNGRQRYADLEAVRMPAVGIRGHTATLLEAWQRYGLPVAITEAHLGCTREDQMRWLAEAWRGAHAATDRGAQVRAVTAWALHGSWDWDSLLTRTTPTHYESGAFDVRGGVSRRTAVGKVIVDLCAGRDPAHPVIDIPGWWRRSAAAAPVSARPLLIVGAAGTLGCAFVRACADRGLPCVPLARPELDIHRVEAVDAATTRWRPWAIINAAGYVRVDDAEREPLNCRRSNVVGASVLAAISRKRQIQLLTFSSDLVFDGKIHRPYVESDAVRPLNVYGRTKVEAERRVLALAPTSLVIRSSAFFGPWDRSNFVTRTLEAIAAGHTVRVSNDTLFSPTYVPDLVDRALDLLIDGATGIWHVSSGIAMSWAVFAQMAAEAAGLNSNAIEGCSSTALEGMALRPRYSVLGSEKGPVLQPVSEALRRYLRDRATVDDAA